MPWTATPPFTPDDYRQWLADWLRNNGTFPGTVAAIYSYQQPQPYDGVVPALAVAPDNGLSAVVAARASRVDGGLLVSYLDATPGEQATDLATIEAAMWANFKAVLARLRADLSWGGVVSEGGAHVDILVNPQGPMTKYGGKQWVEWSMRVSYKGQRENT